MSYISGLISIIVPVFNVRKYLDICLESIVSQSYSNIEIIAVDDGSGDGSGALCDEWGRKDSRVRVFHKENGGLYSARNMGLEKARGEFIGFVDSDDYIKKDMYADMIQAMKENIDIVCCGTVVMQEQESGRLKKIELYDMCSGKVYLTNQKAVKELLLKRYLSFSACDKLYRRELLNGMRFPAKRISEDMLFNYEAVKKSRKVVNIGKAEYFYRYRNDSLSRKGFTIDRVNYVLAVRDILKDIEQCYPQEIKPAEALYIRNVTAVIHEIDGSGTGKEYQKIRERLKKLLMRKYINILLNEYISTDMKKDITKLIF